MSEIEYKELQQTSIITIFRNYLDDIFNDDAIVTGMKGLLTDKETTTSVALVLSMNEILHKDVYLLESIDTKEEGDTMFMKAVIIVRPTGSSIDAILAHLAKPKFKEYHIFFTNILNFHHLNLLAEADEFCVVKQIKEIYCDYNAITHSLWSLNLPKLNGCYKPFSLWDSDDRNIFQRCIDGIFSMLLANKRRPLIRYQKSSNLCQKLATEVSNKIEEEYELFSNFLSDKNTVLIVLDRRTDPQTPLLMQWTYQSLINELCGGIVNNIVDLTADTSIKSKVVVSCTQDNFFSKVVHYNYAQIGPEIKKYVQEIKGKKEELYKLVKNKNYNTKETVENLREFNDLYPDYKLDEDNCKKHLALLSKISKEVEARHLMEVSELEQSLVCDDNHNTALNLLSKRLEDPNLTDDDRLKLVILYALKFECENNQLPILKSILREKTTNEETLRKINAIDTLIQICGSKFNGKIEKNILTSTVSNLFTIVDNVYIRHKPVLCNTLTELQNGHLKTKSYPYVGKDKINEGIKPLEVFVFIIGGVTFTEALHCDKMTNDNFRVVLGGTSVLNSNSFITDMMS